MVRFGMVIDLDLCIGCYACTLACKLENGSPKGIWFAPVFVAEKGKFPETQRIFVPTLCCHCEDPPCVKACPTGAIGRRSDGIVLIDDTKCCGSRACIAACPYGAIHFYERDGGEFGTGLTPHEEFFHGKYKKGTAVKCTFCAHRINEGLEPACVTVCPTACRIFGDLDDPRGPLSKLRETSVKPRESVGSNPSVTYLPPRGWEIE